MALVRCRHCGEDTFAISGWVDLDRCAHCGRPLGDGQIELDAALAAGRRLPSASPPKHKQARRRDESGA